LKEGDDERIDGIISDKAAGLYGSFFSIGMIISPILGSLVFEHYKEED
jgi:MFS family permease